MYAVVATGGKQYRVHQGSVLRIEAIKGEVGTEVTFNDIVIFSDGEILKIGQPCIEGTSVRGRILSQSKSKKILVFKYKKRKRYRRKYGHRQHYTAVLIEDIGSI